MTQAAATGQLRQADTWQPQAADGLYQPTPFVKQAGRLGSAMNPSQGLRLWCRDEDERLNEERERDEPSRRLRSLLAEASGGRLME